MLRHDNISAILVNPIPDVMARNTSFSGIFFCPFFSFRGWAYSFWEKKCIFLFFYFVFYKYNDGFKLAIYTNLRHQCFFQSNLKLLCFFEIWKKSKSFFENYKWIFRIEFSFFWFFSFAILLDKTLILRQCNKKERMIFQFNSLTQFNELYQKVKKQFACFSCYVSFLDE